MSNIGQINAFLRTDQGQVRDHNEDYIAYWEPETADEERLHGWLYIVADGVGGADAGEVASQYACERTKHHYLANHEIPDWGDRLRQSIQAANNDLRQMVAEQEFNTRMATTMVAATIRGLQATIANVGDSRGYYWQPGTLQQITKDQSLVARLLEEGAITAEEAINHPRKNVILHSLGSESSPPIDLYDITFAPGEALILCSDGLTRHVSDEEIAEIVGQQPPAEASQTLIDLANERGGEDNISVAIILFGAADAPQSMTSTEALTDDPPAPTMPTLKIAHDGHEREQVVSGRSLWFYTGFLCFIQTILIILVWLTVTA